jgi:hypothetical protein
MKMGYHMSITYLVYQDMILDLLARLHILNISKVEYVHSSQDSNLGPVRFL